jgi:hypothetical protein
MSLSHTSALLLCSLSLPLLPAQQASLIVSNPSPVLLRSDVAGQGSSVSLPANSTGLVQSLSHNSPPPVQPTSVRADFDWASEASSLGASLTIRQAVSVYGPGPANGSVEAPDLLLQLQATATLSVNLELAREVDANAPGGNLAVWRIDVGDDGSFEATETSPGIVTVPVQLTAQPLRIRVASVMGRSGGGNMEVITRITARPRSALSILPAITGCGITQLLVQPTLQDGGIDISSDSLQPVAAVLGLGTNPVLMPSPLSSACLLLPRNDAVVLLLPSQSFQLVVPPGLRPLLVFAQGVDLFPAVSTTNGFAIVAP